MNFLVGVLLNEGARGAMHALVGIAAFIAVLILAVILAPVAILAALFGLTGPAHPSPSTPWANAPAPVMLAQLPPAGFGATPVDVARRYLGVPYVFGGTNPATGLDCSGLVQLVFRELGTALPRTAQQQYDATTRLTRDQLQPGDLVFFARTYADPYDWITHVGIYIGDGQQINAPTEGESVSIQPVFSGFWGAHFVSGGRVSSARAAGHVRKDSA
jgi:cell wall-associated NlpC family hydrolase